MAERDLVAAVDRAARLWPDRRAWTFDPGESLTFADVARRSAGLAAALADRGIVAGDRVAVMMHNRAEFPRRGLRSRGWARRWFR